MIDEHFDDLVAATNTQTACALLGRVEGYPLPAPAPAGGRAARPASDATQRPERA